MKILPYLYFEGNSIEAIKYYQMIFGGEIQLYSQYKDLEEYKNNIDFKNKGEYYLHGELITKYFEIHFADCYDHVTFGNNIYLSLQIEDSSKLDEIYNYFSVEAKHIGMPIGDTFWGSRYASFTDKFGIKWMLNCDLTNKK